jgi:hypothetical protein
MARMVEAADEGSGKNPFDSITHGDPEKNQYLRDLIDGILEGRRIAATYNLVVLGVVLLLSVLHLYSTYRDRRKWMERVNNNSAPDGKRVAGAPQPSHNGEGESSSSSTLVGGDDIPPDTKQTDLDLEERPLLGSARDRRIWRPLWGVKAWLAYQPQPLPIINRQLPANGASVFVLAWLGLNVFLHFYRLPLESKYFFLFAERCGCMFIVNLPLLYLLAAKTQPLRVLTGRSYEALNIFHRRLGEMMCLIGAVHMVSMLIWRFCLEPDWLLRGDTAREYLLHPLILEGFGALMSYELLYFTSLGSFRQRWYEIFLASHVILQTLALVFLWFHFHTSRPYVGISSAIFLIDRLVWRLTLKSFTTIASLSILEDGESLMLSADWDIPSTPTSKLASLFQHNIQIGWSPTDHVFLTIPALGRTHALQSHPFTIASAAPPIPSWDVTSTVSSRPPHAWLSLLIRSHNGFTASLLHHALLHPNLPLQIRLDGPYGSPHALSLLRASSTAILIAGGSGIAVIYPLAEALLLHGQTCGQKVKMLWVVHSDLHRRWIPEERLAELREMGAEVMVSEPTGLVGRPDVGGYVTGWIEDDGEGDVGVVCSGPDGLNRGVRNVCARETERGRRVAVAVEKFGW